MDRLRRRLADRADSEHEQILIRMVIAFLALAYLQASAWAADEDASLAAGCLPLAVGYLSGALLLFAHLLHRPGVLPARRFAGWPSILGR